MIKFAICDDNRQFSEAFAEKIINVFLDMCTFDEEAECIYYENAKMCLSKFEEDKIDIYFIDIEYGDVSGHELARELEKLRTNVGIVYVTNHEQYVYKSFVCRPLGFIRKKVVLDDLSIVMVSVCEFLERDRRLYSFFDNKKEIIIRADEIRYILVKDHYVAVFLKEGAVELRDRLVRIEKQLEKKSFAKISRSCIVNLKYVKDVNNTTITMVNKENLHISEERKAETFYKWKLYKMKF